MKKILLSFFALTLLAACTKEGGRDIEQLPQPTERQTTEPTAVRFDLELPASFQEPIIEGEGARGLRYDMKGRKWTPWLRHNESVYVFVYIYQGNSIISGKRQLFTYDDDTKKLSFKGEGTIWSALPKTTGEYKLRAFILGDGNTFTLNNVVSGHDFSHTTFTLDRPDKIHTVDELKDGKVSLPYMLETTVSYNGDGTFVSNRKEGKPTDLFKPLGYVAMFSIENQLESSTLTIKGLTLRAGKSWIPKGTVLTPTAPDPLTSYIYDSQDFNWPFVSEEVTLPPKKNSHQIKDDRGRYIIWMPTIPDASTLENRPYLWIDETKISPVAEGAVARSYIRGGAYTSLFFKKAPTNYTPGTLINGSILIRPIFHKGPSSEHNFSPFVGFTQKHLYWTGSHTNELRIASDEEVGYLDHLVTFNQSNTTFFDQDRTIQNITSSNRWALPTPYQLGALLPYTGLSNDGKDYVEFDGRLYRFDAPWRSELIAGSGSNAGKLYFFLIRFRGQGYMLASGETEQRGKNPTGASKKSYPEQTNKADYPLNSYLKQAENTWHPVLNHSMTTAYVFEIQPDRQRMQVSAIYLGNHQPLMGDEQKMRDFAQMYAAGEIMERPKLLGIYARYPISLDLSSQVDYVHGRWAQRAADRRTLAFPVTGLSESAVTATGTPATISLFALGTQAGRAWSWYAGAPVPSGLPTPRGELVLFKQKYRPDQD